MKLAELLRQHWKDYAHRHRLKLCHEHYRAANSVLTCRSAEQGGHLYRCVGCQRSQFSYHSCNHRNCTQCGSRDQHLWSLKQEARLLPCDYFLVTFTVPEELRGSAMRHPKIFYDLLLKESAATLQDVAQHKLNGRLGFTGILHTWGRQLQYHPHVHFIIPAVGYNPVSKKLKRPSKGDFLLSSRPLAKRFAIRMARAIESISEVHNALDQSVKTFLKTVHHKSAKNWVVHLQHAGNGKTAVRYLARYVHRSALSDDRLKGTTADGKVEVQWRSSKTQQIGKLYFKTDELIRRWLQHVLPKGFMRLRHFGFMSPAAKKTRLLIRLLLGELGEPEVIIPDLAELKCSHCGAELQWKASIERRITNKAPP